jgi:hypothetical protein
MEMHYQKVSENLVHEKKTFLFAITTRSALGPTQPPIQ